MYSQQNPSIAKLIRGFLCKRNRASLIEISHALPFPQIRKGLAHPERQLTSTLRKYEV